ncbi:MAG: cytochrome c3 family protein, partial [Acidobacteriota bacterium]
PVEHRVRVAGVAAARYGVQSSCQGCHGDGAAHVSSGEVEDIFGFGLEVPATVKSDQCLSCHGDSHPRFFATAHAQAGLACTSCHAIHADGSTGLLTPPAGPIEAELAQKIGRASASCSTCHSGVMTQFSFNERHRLREGTLGCVDCHNSHEPSSRLQLAGFKQDSCITCHADKGGPFVFEHGAQRIEGCSSCHSPHGSPNRHMLYTQSVADQCYSCHAFVPGFHTRFNNETQCTNCHVSIHGSNFDAGYLR